jgi:hypothetical protein
MFSKLLLASIATIGLLLTGPQKASAQVVYACVSSIGNIAIVAANANCPPAVGGATWTKISWNATTSGGGGALAAGNFQCTIGNSYGPGVAFNFTPDTVSFGSGISTPATPPFSTFMLQKGTYQINLSGIKFSPSAATPANVVSIVANLNNAFTTTSWPFQISATPGTFEIVGGERLVSVGSNNTTLQFIQDSNSEVNSGNCWLVITRLQ